MVDSLFSLTCCHPFWLLSNDWQKHAGKRTFPIWIESECSILAHRIRQPVYNTLVITVLDAAKPLQLSKCRNMRFKLKGMTQPSRCIASTVFVCQGPLCAKRKILIMHCVYVDTKNSVALPSCGRPTVFRKFIHKFSLLGFSPIERANGRIVSNTIHPLKRIEWFHSLVNPSVTRLFAVHNISGEWMPKSKTWNVHVEVVNEKPWLMKLYKDPNERSAQRLNFESCPTRGICDALLDLFLSFYIHYFGSCYYAI